MNRSDEIVLVEEAIALKQSRTAFLTEAVTSRASTIYGDAARFQLERERVFLRLSHAIAHGGTSMLFRVG